MSGISTIILAIAVIIIAVALVLMATWVNRLTQQIRDIVEGAVGQPSSHGDDLQGSSAHELSAPAPTRTSRRRSHAAGMTDSNVTDRGSVGTSQSIPLPGSTSMDDAFSSASMDAISIDLTADTAPSPFGASLDAGASAPISEDPDLLGGYAPRSLYDNAETDRRSMRRRERRERREQRRLAAEERKVASEERSHVSSPDGMQMGAHQAGAGRHGAHSAAASSASISLPTDAASMASDSRSVIGSGADPLAGNTDSTPVVGRHARHASHRSDRSASSAGRRAAAHEERIMTRQRIGTPSSPLGSSNDPLAPSTTGAGLASDAYGSQATGRTTQVGSRSASVTGQVTGEVAGQAARSAYASAGNASQTAHNPRFQERMHVDGTGQSMRSQQLGAAASNGAWGEPQAGSVQGASRSHMMPIARTTTFGTTSSVSDALARQESISSHAGYQQQAAQGYAGGYQQGQYASQQYGSQAGQYASQSAYQQQMAAQRQAAGSMGHAATGTGQAYAAQSMQGAQASRAAGQVVSQASQSSVREYRFSDEDSDFFNGYNKSVSERQEDRFGRKGPVIPFGEDKTSAPIRSRQYTDADIQFDLDPDTVDFKRVTGYRNLREKR